MAYNYDKLYGETPDALGAPTQIFVDFFRDYVSASARILDVGCGQGRDALFIARLGRRVVGVDLSANGIRDLNAAAAREDLVVDGIVADVTSFVPEGVFDVILIDRTLHMLPKQARSDVLARLLGHVSQGGWVLIADETSNIADFHRVIAADPYDWTTSFAQKGNLFVQRT